LPFVSTTLSVFGLVVAVTPGYQPIGNNNEVNTTAPMIFME
jgi:hypothetical protein